MNNSITTEPPQAPAPAPAPTPTAVTLTELIRSLEQATAMAKQLPSTTNPTHLLQIYTSLHQSNHLLSSFLSHPQFPNPPPPPPPHATAENSLSTGAAEDEPMQIGDDDQDGNCEEDSSNAMIDNVEERMRDCFIKSKRAKRPLSPAAVAAMEERRLLGGDGDGGGLMGFDPYGSRLRALELIYQFHS